MLVIFYRSTSSAGAGSNPLNQLLLTAPPATNGPTPTTKVDPKMDLLSGDDFGSPKADSLALVPVSGQQPTAPVSQQNALALMDMFGSDNAPNSVNVASQINPSPPQFQGGFYPNGSAPNMGAPQYEQAQAQYTQGAGPAWNGQIVQSQQPPSPGYGALFNKLFSLTLHLHSLRIRRCNHGMTYHCVLISLSVLLA